MLMQFSKKFMNKCPAMWDYLSSSYWNNIVTYCIDSKYRISRDLSPWLKEQNLVATQLIADTIPTKDSYDEQVIECLIWVRAHILYVGDWSNWKIQEKWSTPDETLKEREGDCEDGAILLYQLCRLKGVPANRMLIICGDVDGGGHAWLAYKPEEYPLNFVFLDWCYWPNMNGIGERKFYEISEKEIYESQLSGQERDKQYFNIWFAFNETKSHSELIYKPHET